MRPTRAEISLRAIQYNLEAVRKKIGTSVKVMGIVKANAYGHGLVETSKAFVKFGIDYLGVGFLEEGIILRQNGITCPILVLGGVLGDQVQHFLANDLDITVSSVELAERIEREVAHHNSKKAKVHLKIDTGMERIGVHSDNALQFAQKVAALQHIEIVGIYSHFATAEAHDKSFAYSQLDRFSSALNRIKSAGIEIPLQHIANSGAVLDLPESYFTMVRPGIILYGLYPSDETTESIPIETVLSLKSKVVFIKIVEANTSISYGRKYFTSLRTKIATIPIGYGDGYNRRLTNQTNVIIKGQLYPVVGAICMDQIMVDIGDSDIHIGDDVTLIGNDKNAAIGIWELANKVGTNAYELMCSISARVPRIYL
ncbi:MAG: alanine racemase [Bacteroidota bacterium]|nr:alanine racemase [Bacteroidota bacterium]